jgi:hypothetical protein
MIYISKLIAKNSSFLTKNTAFEHKFHFDKRKWQKRQNGGQFTIPLAMKWSRDHVLTCGYRRDMTVDLDKLKIISSGSVAKKMQKSVCHLAVIFGV